MTSPYLYDAGVPGKRSNTRLRRLVRLRWPRAARVIIYLALAAYTLAWSNYNRPRHFALLGVCAYVFDGRTYHPRSPHALVVEEGGTLRVVGVYTDEWARIDKGRRPGEVVRGTLMAFPWSRSVGLLAPVRESFEVTMNVGDDPYAEGAPLTQPEVDQVRPLYADFMRDGWWGRSSPMYLTFFVEGDGARTIIHWGWLLHDAAVVALLVLTLASSARYGARQRRVSCYRKRRQLLEEGSCPACRYAVAGLRPRGLKNCPECGRPLRP